MPHFEWPWALAALALIPLLAWRRLRMNRPAIAFNFIAALPTTFRQRHAYLPSLFRWLALTVTIVSAARPVWNAQPVITITKSIGIQIVIDRSSSMKAMDMPDSGPARSRLDVLKQLSEAFIFGNGRDLRGRPSDLIGLVEFAGDPVTLSPLTLSHDQLRGLIDSVQPAHGNDDGTAIGDAIAVAAARFQVSPVPGAAPLKSKIIILLTDGENNLGHRSPAEAAQLAKKWGVRIYAIGILGEKVGSIADEALIAGLDVLAMETGGLSRTARDASALRSIYADIDRLEPTDTTASTPTGGRRFIESIAAAALFLLVFSVLLEQTAMRRLP